MRHAEPRSPSTDGLRLTRSPLAARQARPDLRVGVAGWMSLLLLTKQTRTNMVGKTAPGQKPTSKVPFRRRAHVG
jgi:hypothetical protein